MKMTAAAMIKMVKDIDERFDVKEITYKDDRDRTVKAIEVSLKHAVHGRLKHVTDVAEGDLIMFWAEQNKRLLDMTVEEQIQESANQMRLPVEWLREHLEMKAAASA